MKIPWVEEYPWLASVATRYSLNVLTRQTEQKETSFMKILPAKHRGRLAGWSVAGRNSSKGPCDLWRGVMSFPHPSKPFIDFRLVRRSPLCQSPTLELIAVGDTFRWTIRIFLSQERC